MLVCIESGILIKPVSIAFRLFGEFGCCCALQTVKPEIAVHNDRSIALKQIEYKWFIGEI